MDFRVHRSRNWHDTMCELTVLDRHELGDDVITINDSDFPILFAVITWRSSLAEAEEIMEVRLYLERLRGRLLRSIRASQGVTRITPLVTHVLVPAVVTMLTHASIPKREANPTTGTLACTAGWARHGGLH